MTDRNLNLTSRKEDTRDITPVVKFDLNKIVEHFYETVDDITEQFTLAEELRKSGKHKEKQNIYRAQIIFLESAFDFYMHEVTKYGLCKIYNGDWEETKKYKNISVNMEAVEEALRSDDEEAWFLDYINNLYQNHTMVSFSEVKNQFNLLGIDVAKVANRAFYHKGAKEKTKDKMKRRLDELHHRRNYIVHQSDREHSNAQIKGVIKKDVDDFIKDIVKIVDSIDNEIRSK